LDILAAEDTPFDMELLQLGLAKCGGVRSLQIVQDGRELIDYLSGMPPFEKPDRQAPNIIFMDLKMPRMNGFEVLQWLRNNPSYSVIPAIMMSTSDRDDDVLNAYRLGVNAYFQKPSSFKELEDVIYSILKFWSHARRPMVTFSPRREHLPPN
jgi:two-component system response regulator